MKKSAAFLFFSLIALVAPHVEARPWRIYVGTYTTGNSQGIYQLGFEDESGALNLKGLAVKGKNPSFLAFHPVKPVLYASSELENGAGVAAYAIDKTTGQLSLLNGQPAGGIACHVSVSPDGKLVGVANYGAGSCAVYPTGEDGALGPAIATFQHRGSSTYPKRQAGPHAHSANFDPTGQFLIVPDLGIDKLMVYQITGSRVAPHDPPFAAIAPGSGPRHFAFHPGGRWAYVVNEMGNTVTALHWNPAKGTLESFQTIGTLPEDFHGASTTAHIEVHPSGQFLYVSNRGHDSLSVFAIDPATGALRARGHTSTGGKTPRNFTQDPSGRYLLAANMESNDIVVFAINQDSGALTPTGVRVEVPTPTCVVFEQP